MPITNVVELKQVVSRCETASLKEVAKAIHIKLNLADQNDNEARNHRIEAGEMLVTLRQRVEADGQDWWKFAKDYFDRTRKELEKLMFVAANHVAKAAIKANPKMSDRAIAAEVGIGHATVSRARQEAATVSNETVEKRIGKDGKARKMPEPKRAKSKQAKPQQPEPTRSKKPTKPAAELTVIQLGQRIPQRAVSLARRLLHELGDVARGTSRPQR